LSSEKERSGGGGGTWKKKKGRGGRAVRALLESGKMKLKRHYFGGTVPARRRRGSGSKKKSFPAGRRCLRGGRQGICPGRGENQVVNQTQGSGPRPPGLSCSQDTKKEGRRGGEEGQKGVVREGNTAPYLSPSYLLNAKKSCVLKERRGEKRSHRRRPKEKAKKAKGRA